MVFDSFAIYILWERPESIEVDFITEPCSKCVHEESRAGALDENLVCQPVTVKKKTDLII